MMIESVEVGNERALSTPPPPQSHLIKEIEQVYTCRILNEYTTKEINIFKYFPVDHYYHYHLITEKGFSHFSTL